MFPINKINSLQTSINNLYRPPKTAITSAKKTPLILFKMQFSKTFLSSLFVAAAVASPTPDNTYANEVRALFENIDPLTSELITRVVEMGSGLESRDLKSRDWVNNVCDSACVISV